MPTPEEAIEIVRSFALSFTSGKPMYDENVRWDIGKTLSFLTDDIYWKEEVAEFAKRGKATIGKLLEGVAVAYPGQWSQIHTIFSDGHNVGMEYDWGVVDPAGKEIVLHVFSLFKLTGAGKIYHWHDYYNSPQAKESYDKTGILE